MISLEQIAELSGVSRRTVARALKDPKSVKATTYAKIEAVLKEQDYKPNLAARYLVVRKKNFKILFMLMRAKSSPYHAFLYEEAQKKAEEIKAFGVNVDFLLLDRDEQTSSIAFQALREHFDYDFAILLPVYEEYFRPYFDELLALVSENNVPFMFYNMDDKAYPRLSYVGCDYQKAGRIAAGLIALCTQEQGNIAIISNRAQSLISFHERITGFKDELAQNYPKLTIAYRCLMEHGIADVDVKSLIKLKVKAIYLVNPGDYKLCQIIKETPGLEKVKIITNDSLPISDPLLKQGFIDALITQEPKMQAALPLELAFDFLVNGKKDIQDQYITNLSVLIKQCI